MIRIIDNKKIDLTESEFKYYNELCRSYDRPPNIKGEELFKNLFESDKNGIVIFLKPPHNQMISMEVYMFLMSIMTHQHLRVACGQVNDLINEAKEIIREAKELISNLKK